MIRRLAFAFALVLVGCEAEIPDGRLLCDTAAPDCPDGFVCCPAAVSGDYDGLCFRAERCQDVDAGAPADGGTADAGAADAGAGDGGTADAGAPDAGPTGPRPARVAAGADHSCLLAADDSVWCWGKNSEGQLGTGMVTSGNQTTPVAVVSLPTGIEDIAAAREATCVRTDAAIHCWGDNRIGLFNEVTGVLGQSGVLESDEPLEVMLEHGPPHDFDLGAWFGCAIVGTDRHLECWGDNTHGQLGIGSTEDREIPVDVPDLSGVRDFCAGGEHACAVLEDGSLRCWGRNRRGQLGNGESGVGVRAESPLEVTALTSVIDVECGAQHTCAVTETDDGRTLHCWGDNRSGEIGVDPETMDPVPSPVALGVEALDDPTVLALGGRDGEGVTCAASATARLHCFGSNSGGFLGRGSVTPFASSVPEPVLNLRENVVDAALGWGHVCAIDGAESGEPRVLCWGEGGRGELGNADSGNSNTPVLVFGFGGGA